MKSFGKTQKASRIFFNPCAWHCGGCPLTHAMWCMSAGNTSFSTSPPLLPEQEKVAQLRWSLARLIALVPKCIITPQGTFNNYLFHISGDFISYSHEENGEHISNLIFVRCNGDYVSGMISIIIWLIQKRISWQKIFTWRCRNKVKFCFPWLVSAQPRALYVQSCADFLCSYHPFLRSKW